MAAYPSAAQATQKLPKAGFFWALGIFLVTAVAGAVLFVMGINEIVSTVDGLDPISTGGVSDLQLEAGDHWVFAAVPSGSAQDLVDVTITDPNGATQTLSQETLPTGETTTDGEQFVPLGFFDADVAGTYQFEASGPPGTDVRVGRLDLPKILWFMFGGIGLAFVGFVIALIILIVTLVRRGGHKKRQREAAYSGGGYGGGGYGGAPGQYPAPPQGQAPYPSQPQAPAPQWPPAPPPP